MSGGPAGVGVKSGDVVRDKVEVGAKKHLLLLLIELKRYLGLLRNSLRETWLTMVRYSSWFCHSSDLNINVSSFIVICEM